jgi:hypothetical protein
MNPTDDLGLPPAPPLPPDVRERALRTVLDGLDGPDAPARPGPGARRGRLPRWAPLLTAAAALATVAVAATITIPGAGPLPPATGTPLTGTPTTTPAPIPPEDLPTPTGDARLDDALARCATAVLRNPRADQYPQPRTWRAATAGAAFPEEWLVINDELACLATPESVTVSPSWQDFGRVPDGGEPGTDGEPDVFAARMGPGLVALLNPDRDTITTELLGTTAAPVIFLPADDATLDGLRMTIDGGEVVIEGPLTSSPMVGVRVVDRPRPQRPDTPDGAELAACLDLLPPGTVTAPELWIPVGRHDVGGGAPPALLARIADVAVGVCVQDPAGGSAFVSGPPLGDRPLAFMRHRGGTAAVVLVAPAGVTGMEVAAATRPEAPVPCTIIDGLAVCTLDDPRDSGADGLRMVVTAATASDPGGVEVYRG